VSDMPNILYYVTYFLHLVSGADYCHDAKLSLILNYCTNNVCFWSLKWISKHSTLTQVMN